MNAKELIRAVREDILKSGWIQNSEVTNDGVCLVGGLRRNYPSEDREPGTEYAYALDLLLKLRPPDQEGVYKTETFIRENEHRIKLDLVVLKQELLLAGYNDAHERTKEDIVSLLEEAEAII